MVSCQITHTCTHHQHALLLLFRASQTSLGVTGSGGGGFFFFFLGGGGVIVLGATWKTNKWLKGLYMFTGRWAHGHGVLGVDCSLWRLLPSWLWNDWSCWGYSSRKMVPVSYGAGKERVNRIEWLVWSWSRHCALLVLGSVHWQKLMSLMSTNPLLIWYSIWSHLWSLHCSSLFHFRLSRRYCMVPAVLSLKLLQVYLATWHCTF